MIMTRVPLLRLCRSGASWRLLLAVACALLGTACAALRGQGPPPDTAPPLPEVVDIDFQGNKHFKESELEKVMVTKEPPLIPPWKSGGEYNPPTLEADLRRLRKFYFDRGYLDAEVRLGEVREDQDKNTVAINILIDEGAPTLIQSLDLAGTVPSQLPPKAELVKALPLKVGKRITKEAFDQSKALLLNRLLSAGYARADVTPRTEVDPQQHTAVVTFTLQPRQRTRFGDITIKGAKRVRETAIRHQLKIKPGDIYNEKRLTSSVDAIYGMGMFQAVTPRALNPEADGEPLQVEFEVQERKPRTLRLGGGVSTVEGFRVLAAWTHRNIFGGAERLTLSTQIATFSQNLEQQLSTPFFLAPRTTLTQTFFARNQAEITFPPFNLIKDALAVVDPQPNFDLLSLGGGISVNHRFTVPVSATVGVEVSWNDFSNIDTESLGEDELSNVQDNILFIQFTEVQYDTRNSPLDPTRGVFLRGRLDHSNSAMLSDVSFVKVVLEGRHYLRLWGAVILATRLEIGGIKPYGDSDDVPFNVRFFAGGPGSVRGFKLNRLGPLDEDGDPIGGKSLIDGSVELRFPIYGPVGAVLFVDFGNVFRDSFTYRLDGLRYAVGPGLRYKTPIGPLRVDVGFIVDRREEEDFGRVEFSIGQAF
jgi:outer membrane protein assembly complex protein YaeT